MSLCGNIVTLICLLISLNLAAGAVSEIRWCTISPHEETKCANMKAAFAAKSLPTLMCVAGQSVQDCMEKINSNKADLITLDGGDVYVAGLKYNMIPIMQEVYGSNSKGYYAVAVVKKSNTAININNLQGKKSCHTGVRKTAGWNVPIGYLLENNKINPTDCQDDIRAAGNFFNQSCAPGAMSSAYNPNNDNPDNLCALCQTTGSNPCPRDSSELYYGYTGAFRCLVEGGGDVAFIKPVTVTDNTDGNNVDSWASSLRSQDYELLCQDGTRKAVANYENCNLAFVPSHAVMASKNYADAVLQDFRQILRDAQDLFGEDGNSNGFSMFASPSGQSDLLYKDSTQSLDDVVNKEYTDYLGADYLGTIRGLGKCPANTLRLCVTSQAEKSKCRAMKAAFTGANLTPPLSCYMSYSADACASDISKDVADLVTLDGGKLYQNGKRNDSVVPVLAEDYGNGDASYWAVVVVKRSSSFTINELKGKKSCHTGYMRTAGWVIPIGFLVNRGDITADDKCEIPKAVGQFFSQSCVPSVLDPLNNPNDNNPANLCALCNGPGNDNCKGNANEPYAGYNGAFRCLLEDSGDVAFVKHSTVPGLAANPPSWATDLIKADYQLLCPDGTRADVDNYMDCNLAKVPSHTVVTSGQKTSGEKTQMVTLLQSGQDQFKLDTGSGFKMFDSSDASYGQHQGNLIFKDSTIQLLATGEKDTYDKFLSKEYLADVDALHCEKGPNNGATILPSIMLLLVATVINRLLRG